MGKNSIAIPKRVWPNCGVSTSNSETASSEFSCIFNQSDCLLMTKTATNTKYAKLVLNGQ